MIGYQKIIEVMKNGGLVHENNSIASYLEGSTYDRILDICKENLGIEK